MGRPDLEAAVPRTLEGRPDLSGVWRRAANEPPRGSDLRSDIAEIPLLPAARELYERRIAADGAGVSSERCLPHGLPMEMMFRDTPFRIVQTPTLTVILLENMGRFRQVPTNGRTLVANPEPTWFGYSTGRWDSDDFVVETTGFNEATWLDHRGLPHTDALQLTERFKRVSVGRMDLVLTVEDVKAYARPWSVTIRLEFVPDTDLLEFVCEHNKFKFKPAGQ